MVSAIKVMTDEPTLKFDENGLKVRTMDPSRVAMIDMEISKSAFEEWTPGGTPKIGVNLMELEKLLKRSGKDEATTISLDEKTGKLKVAISGKYSKVFTLPTLEPSEEEVPTPKLTFNAKFKFITSTLSQVLEDAQLVSDHIKVTTNQDGVAVNAQGDLMTANIALDKTNGLLDLEAKEESKATYSLSYLMEMLKTMQALSDLGEIEYSTDMPMKLTFNKDEVIKIAWYLAPRIETD